MSALSLITSKKPLLDSLTAKLAWAPALILRISVGLVFASTGWGKVHNIGKVTSFFTELHIPMPHLNAIVVGWTELIGGSLLVLGLATRLAALPLAFSMMVALATAKKSEIHGLLDLVGEQEFTFVAILISLAFLGAGKVSVDGWAFGGSVDAKTDDQASNPRKA